MRIHEILTEAKISFTVADVQKAAAESEFGVVYLTMAGNGDLLLGDIEPAYRDVPAGHHDVSHRRRLNIQLWVADKKIRFRGGAAGESLKPKVQQALRSLRDAGIIDATWTVQTSSEASSYVAGKFTSHPNPVDEKSLDELVDKAIRLSPVTTNLVLYHGTSTLDWEKIQKVGLHPLGYGTNNQNGSESRGKHDGNQKVLYLAGTPTKALDYAKTRVADWNRKLHGSEYNYDENNDPVILAVTVPDTTRLVADDDVVNELARGIARTLWKAKSQDERRDIAIKLGQERGFNASDDVASMLWRETDKGFAEIFAKIPPRIFKVWKASLMKRDQVGYKGMIPPKFIKRVLI